MNARAPLFMLMLLAASHGVNDLLAGWLIGGHIPEAGGWSGLPWLAVYAALAFGGQLPAAWVMDRTGRPGAWLALSLGLMVLLVAAEPLSFGGAVIVSGMASALVHVAGGALALRLPQGPRALGWFSAPGILGLTLGGWLGTTQGALAPWASVLPAAVLAGWWALRAHWPEPAPRRERVCEAPFLEAHDGWMLLLLLALTLRSAVWDLVQVARQADPAVWLAIAISAAVGKVLGGYVSAYWGGMRPVSLMLVLSCALLNWGRDRVAAVCIGIALLQGAIPGSIVLLHERFGSTPERAVAYGLGLTVALGGVAWMAGITLPVAALGLGALALAMLWRGRRRRCGDGLRTAPAA